ncbi:MAG: tetratricopeptide repeat protein, partial [Bacteroidia bacterium]|nr:tetratricopeptide repeat protein [Bacteroidia bacterium]
MKRRVFLIATLMILASVYTFGQNAKKCYKAGMELVENLKYEDAVAQFTTAIGLEPSNPDYYYARGQAYVKLLKYTDAKADFEKVIVFAPKNVDAIISLGAVCNKTNNFEEALKLLNHASTMDKRNTNNYQEKVITLIALEKYDQALKVSDTTIRLKDIPMDYYYRGEIYKKLKNEVLSKNEYEKAILRDKNLVIARLALADLLLLTNPMEAMSQCNQVIIFDDRNTEAYLLRSEIYKKNLDYPSAINDVSKNIMIDPTNPAYYLARGICYQEFNQHTNALADFTKYITLKPDDPDAYFARAKSYEGIMNYDKAIADYAKIAVLSEFDMKAQKMLKEAKARLYELNRESDPPEIVVVNPAPVKDTIEIRGDKPAI